MSLLFNMLSSLAITFLQRSKHLLISWLQSPSALILEPKKIKSATVSTVSLSVCHEVMEPDAMILVFWMLSLNQLFLYPLLLSSRVFSSSLLSSIRVVSFPYLRLVIFLPAILILACASSSPTFLMIYSAYKLNKQGDNIQSPWTPWTLAYQAPPFMDFSDYWSGLPFPSPGDLSDPGIKPRSPALQTDTLPSEPSGKQQ